MTRTIRVGAVNYLNTKPLIHGLDSLAPHWKLSLDVPSRLADQLALGKLDVALIPVVEYFRHPGYRVVPGISIASNGPVLSVTLFCKMPWEKIRTIGLDTGSRTSIALLRILSRMKWGLDFKSQPLDLTDDPLKVSADAVLLIGDRAMKACLPQFPYSYDLGKEWTAWTGLPFVYAFWAVHPQAFEEDLEPGLTRAKEAGLSRAGEIAEEESARLGLDPGFCRRYLAHVLSYNLGSSELSGLKKFQEFAQELELIPPTGELEFHGGVHFAKSN
ncbi:MAG: hypothetical protein EXR99_14845 [Gemmataceae bacterium]|nr:hypothetical protein [Gemmataceae bacterium]